MAQKELKVEDLRIGNIFLHAGRKVFVRLTCVSIDGRIVYDVVGTDEKATVSSITALERIELTKAILEKCGFRLTPANNTFRLNIYQRHGDFEKGELAFHEREEDRDRDYDQWRFTCFCDNGGEGYCGEAELPNCLHHLHELQNMFYAITGKELEIEL